MPTIDGGSTRLVEIQGSTGHSDFMGLTGAAVVCGIGFAAGVLSGPVLFATKPNQGLLLGFFFTGPAGAVLGGFIGLVVWSKRAKCGRTA